MTRHTPAPWHTGRGNCHTVYSSQSNGHQRIIARCPTQNGLIEYDSDETLLNAKLIAAAPELFAALVVLYNDIRLNNLTYPRIHNSLTLAFAAIVKADQPGAL